MCRGGGKKREMRGRREGVSGGGCVCVSLCCFKLETWVPFSVSD